MKRAQRYERDRHMKGRVNAILARADNGLSDFPFPVYPLRNRWGHRYSQMRIKYKLDSRNGIDELGGEYQYTEHLAAILFLPECPQAYAVDFNPDWRQDSVYPNDN